MEKNTKKLKGITLIFNDSNRDGSKFDVQTIKQTFESLDYVIVYNEIPISPESVYKENKELINKADIVFVFYMAHGGDDGMDETKKDVRKKYLNPLLSRHEEKFYVFVFQTCRGYDGYKNIDTDSAKKKPNYYILFWATKEGSKAIRKNDGSPFIQKFCELIQDLKNKMGIRQIMDKVNADIADQQATKETNLGKKDINLISGLCSK